MNKPFNFWLLPDWVRARMMVSGICGTDLRHWKQRGIYPEMKICLELLAKGKINAKKMITHSFSLDQINNAFEVANDKQHTGAVFVALTVYLAKISQFEF